MTSRSEKSHRLGAASAAWLGAVMSFAALPLMAQIPSRTIAERLGYPADSKLLIIHADDLAVAHSVDEAAFAALESGAVTSASIMVPCPWLTEVADWYHNHSDADVGLHLTLTSEWKTYRWGPVAPLDQVPTLVDPHGYLWPDVAPVASRATAADVERELRAQVERAISMGIHPTHLDTHMGTLLARADYYEAMIKVAREYHLPFLAARPPLMPAKLAALLGPNDIVLDSVIIFGPGVPPDRWTQTYVERLNALKPGLNEMIVHLGHDDSELEAITVGHPDYGAAWRERDFKAVNSPEFRKALADNHIILVHWKDLKALQR